MEDILRHVDLDRAKSTSHYDVSILSKRGGQQMRLFRWCEEREVRGRRRGAGDSPRWRWFWA